VPPLEKPPVPIPRVEAPPSPEPIPTPPTPRLTIDPSLRLMPRLASPRAMACNPLGSVFGVASELLECGRAKFQRGELEPARADLAAAVQKSSDREVVREARYWLAETLIRLGRSGAAEQHLALVARDDPSGEYGAHAAHTLGWLLLERGEAATALTTFETQMRSGAPPDLIPTLRHGRALSLYGLGRFADAREEWRALLGQSIPRPLVTEASFWLGDTLGRLGDAKGAAERLQLFTAAGPHPLLPAGMLRLAWWRRAAGQPVEAVRTYRALLQAYPQSPEAPFARAGLVQALADTGDAAGAVAEARALEAQDPSGRIARPALLAALRVLVDRQKTDEAQALAQRLLGRQLDPAARAYRLLLLADAQRQSGQPAEARSQLEIVRGSPVLPAFAEYAALRLAQIDLEARELARAQASAEGLVASSQPAVRGAALVVAGEAAYGARRYDRAAEHYAAFANDYARAPEVPAALLALGWSELRRGRVAEARQALARFSRDQGEDPRAPSALLLASELSVRAGDLPEARRQLDRLIQRYPDHELSTVARLNRAILSIRAGRNDDGIRELSALGPRAAASAYAGRVRLARGIAELEAGRGAAAQPELEAALAGGEDLARLGLARLALERRQWDAAARELTAARDTATGLAATAADYGLAGVLYGQGRNDEFAKQAAPLLAGPPDPVMTPALLEAMARVAADGKRWPEARGYALRASTEFRDNPAGPRALAALGRAAARDGQWPIAREAFQALADRHPQFALDAAAQTDAAEALLRTGAAPDARRQLERLAADAAPDPATTPRVLLLLAQAREATGDRAAALETYARLRQDYPGAQGGEAGVVGQGKLLVSEGKWDEARPLYERALANSDPAVAAAAAFELGEGLRARSQHQEAVEYYMTAAYLAGSTPWARRALLGAGQSFAALRQRDAAEIVYRKLAATPNVEPELAEAARRELKALGAN